MRSRRQFLRNPGKAGRFETISFSVSGERRRQIALRLQKAAEIVPRRGPLWIDGQRLAISAYGVFRPSSLVQRGAEVVSDGGVSGKQGGGPGEGIGGSCIEPA